MYTQRLILGIVLSIACLGGCTEAEMANCNIDTCAAIVDFESVIPVWKNKSDSRLWSKRCTIPREENISTQRFMSEYVSPEKPVIITKSTDNADFLAMTTKAALLKYMGNAAIILSSANAHSYEKRIDVLERYISQNMDPQSIDTSADNIMYMFGDNYSPGWAEFLTSYQRPPYLNSDVIGSISFGMGGDGSGVPFHRHGAVFAEVLHGHKRWYLYPKGSTEPPKSHPNRTTLLWTLEHYPTLAKHELPMECVLGANEVLYIPNEWWHATLNLAQSVFISVFV
eukprot:CFRG5309T1